MAFLFTLEEAKSLLDDPDSCFKLVTSTRTIALPHYFAGDHRQGVKELLNLGLKRYSESLDGILVAYFNTSIINRNACIMEDQSYFKFDVKADFIVFRPQIGCTLKGVVNKCSSGHIGCLVHGHFNASIFKQHEDQWNSPRIEVGSVVTFEITTLDLCSKIIFIRGKLLGVQEPDSTCLQESYVTDFFPSKGNTIQIDCSGSVNKIKFETDSDDDSDLDSSKIVHLDADRESSKSLKSARKANATAKQDSSFNVSSSLGIEGTSSPSKTTPKKVSKSNSNAENTLVKVEPNATPYIAEIVKKGAKVADIASQSDSADPPAKSVKNKSKTAGSPAKKSPKRIAEKPATSVKNKPADGGEVKQEDFASIEGSDISSLEEDEINNIFLQVLQEQVAKKNTPMKKNKSDGEDKKSKKKGDSEDEKSKKKSDGVVKKSRKKADDEDKKSKKKRDDAEKKRKKKSRKEDKKTKKKSGDEDKKSKKKSGDEDKKSKTKSDDEDKKSKKKTDDEDKKSKTKSDDEDKKTKKKSDDEDKKSKRKSDHKDKKSKKKKSKKEKTESESSSNEKRKRKLNETSETSAKRRKES